MQQQEQIQGSTAGCQLHGEWNRNISLQILNTDWQDLNPAECGKLLIDVTRKSNIITLNRFTQLIFWELKDLCSHIPNEVASRDIASTAGHEYPDNLTYTTPHLFWWWRFPANSSLSCLFGLKRAKKIHPAYIWKLVTFYSTLIGPRESRLSDHHVFLVGCTRFLVLLLLAND